ncbi:MAG: dihydroorotate dehydrogenase-like protein [Bacteroidetes bacterium]|nr:dihydroorotate dehydrogenase-like protein [Bacteroidota bacterium]
MDLSVNYMGIRLKNPIIVGASNLVTDLDALRKLEDAGAAAIVYKSLFEEQIHLENLENYGAEEDYASRHAEMSSSMFPDMGDAGPDAFLLKLRKAKESIGIPLIASLNAVYEETWVEYAQKIEQTGVDGLEVNFYAVPKEFHIDGRSILTEQLDILQKVKESVKLPIAVKLSPFYTNILYTIAEMDKSGVDAFVLFNRLFQPEIDIDLEEHYFPYNLSNQNDNRLCLRFAGLLFGQTNAKICANSGIYTGEDVISMILAGADTVQVVSTLYKNGIDQIKVMLDEVQAWMEKKNYQKLDDFRGKLSKKELKDPFTYKRAQYVDILMHSNEIFKKYPLI